MNREKTLTSEMLELLRSKNNALIRECSSLKSNLRIIENANLKHKMRVVHAEEDREALYDAVRVLASAVSNDTAIGRRARQEARKILETRRIQPPSALGASRVKKSKKRKRRTIGLDDTHEE